MAKKPLTGHSKLAEIAVSPNPHPTGVTKSPEGVKPKLKNFRLASVDIRRLHTLMDTLNSESDRPISETVVIKALILLGEKTAASKLLKLIKEVR